MAKLPATILALGLAACVRPAVHLGQFPDRAACVVVAPFQIQFSNRQQKEFLSELLAFGLQERRVPGVLMPKDLLFLFQEHGVEFPKVSDPDSVAGIVEQIGGRYVIFGYYSELPVFRSTNLSLAEVKVSVDAYLYDSASREIRWTYSNATIVGAPAASREIQAIADDMADSLTYGRIAGTLPKEPCYRVPAPRTPKAAEPEVRIPAEAAATLASLRRDGTVLGAIAFVERTAVLSKEATPGLYAVAEALRYLKPAESLTIASHVDATEDANADLALAASRADAVKTFLAKLGADPKRIQAVSHGGSEPKAPNISKKSREHNRRVVLRVLTPAP